MKRPVMRLAIKPTFPSPSTPLLNRAACSLQATRQCAPPPLFRLLGLANEQSWEEREACQQRCMATCLQQRSPACQQHAQAFCSEAFAGPVACGELQLASGSGNTSGSVTSSSGKRQAK